MTTPPDPMEGLRQEVATLNYTLVALSRELQASRVETAVRVEGLRAEQNRQRRTRMMVVTVGGLGLFYTTEAHVQGCSPGSRTAAVFNASERGVKDVKVLKHLYDYPPNQTSCDVTMPFISHSIESWPTNANVVGMAVVAALAVLTALYHRWRTRVDFAQVEKAANVEERHAGGPSDGDR
jgi:hypothetical protein